MNPAQRITFTLFSSAVYGMLASVALATVIMNSRSERVTLSTFAFDFRLIGFFISLPAFALGAMGGAALLGFRRFAQTRLQLTLTGGSIGAILGVLSAFLATVFDPTTSNPPAHAAVFWVPFLFALGVGALVGGSYALIFYRWIGGFKLHQSSSRDD